MQKQSWQHDNQASQAIPKTQQQKSKVSQFAIEQIVSERATEEIQDDLTSLRNKQNQTPLVFYCKIGGSYLFSFKKKLSIQFIVRFICLAFFMVGVQLFVDKFSLAPQNIKIVLIILTVFCLVDFLLLFYLDPGTLFEDEQEKIEQQRLYCQTCRVYRSHNSRHCNFCGKCVKGYDHHCGFFGKCIGRRNYLLFCSFIVSLGCVSLGSMASLFYTVFTKTTQKIN